MSVSNDPNQTSIGAEALGSTSQFAVDGASKDFVDDRRVLRPDEVAAIESLPHGSALLIALSGPNADARFLLNSDVVNAGRHARADVFLDDFTVSRRHAQFLREGNAFTVRDSGSLNGTYVNKERIDQAVLKDGDEVQIGKYRLTFYGSRIIMIAAPSRAPKHEEPEISWPQDVSHVPSLRIGEVRTALAAEFPLLTVSKLRHYESLGLVTPHRTPSNQRLFSAADVERLRFVLQEQRDRFLPLTQIGELLRQLDAGESPDEVRSGRMRAIPDDEVRRPQPGTRLRLIEVSDLTGVAVADIEDMVTSGILTTDARGRLTSQSVEIVRYAMMLQNGGFDLRQVRSIKNSAHAHAAMLTAAVAPERAKGSPVAGERAITQSAENATIVSHLYRALLTENVEVNLR